MSNEIISVLLPTRGRTEVLRKSLKSLVEKATKPERIEILFGIDEDDTDTLDYIKDVISVDLKELGIESRASIFIPNGPRASTAPYKSSANVRRGRSSAKLPTA